MLRPESTKATDAGEMEVVVLDTAAAPTTASTTAAAATTTKPPDAPSPPQGLAGRLNDFLHSNIYVYLASYYLYWLAFWVAMPLVGLFTMAGYGIYDLWTAKVWYTCSANASPRAASSLCFVMLHTIP